MATSERKRKNNQKEVWRGPNLIIAVYSPDRKSERIHAHKSHLKHRALFESKSEASKKTSVFVLKWYDAIHSSKHISMQFLFHFNFKKM